MWGDQRKGLFIIALFGSVLIFLQYKLWFDGGGVIDLFHLKHQYNVQKALNDRLRETNLRLYTEIARNEKNSETVEEEARNELGMIKKSETFYQISQKD